MQPPAHSIPLAPVPAGRWAVGVSGGADSVALLLILHHRARAATNELALHVVHLDHETRGAASTGDADFVRELAGKLGLPCTVARRSEIEPAMGELPANPSARYRAARLALFRRTCDRHALDGVVLAHHADDQAETVLHRLLRGSAAAGLAGMAQRSNIAGLTILRPLLGAHRAQLRTFLRDRAQSWREDQSNSSDDYFRNRLRRLLAAHPELTNGLLDLAAACRGLRDYTRRHAPVLPHEFTPGAVRDLPPLLARESLRRWLESQGSPPDQLSRAVVDRLLLMASDAATPPRSHFPGPLLVRRKSGRIFVDRSFSRRRTRTNADQAEE